MTIGSFTGYPKPDNETVWETACLLLFARALHLTHLQKFRRRGQRQYGIDLIGARTNGETVVVQCKLRNTEKGLSREDAEDDVEAAKHLIDDATGERVHIDQFVIATTDDANDHTAWARNVSKQHEREGLFQVAVYSWLDIVAILNAHEDLRRAYLDPTLRLPLKRNLPPLTARFVDRSSELDRLHALLTRPTSRGASLTAGYIGHGGQGKTTLALAYAWRCADKDHPWHNTYPGGCFYVRCGQGSIVDGMAQLAEYCGARTASNPRDTALNVKRALEEAPLSLLVLDNVKDRDQWEGQEFAELLPRVGSRLLVTTRVPGLANVDEVPVGFLKLKQSLALLSAYKPISNRDQERLAAEAIAEWLGGLAVAVAAVGSSLRRKRLASYSAYWKFLQDSSVSALPGGDRTTATELDYQNRAETVIDDAFTSLSAAEQRCVQFAALLPADACPKHWLTHLVLACASDPDQSIRVPLSTEPGVSLSAHEAVVQGLLDSELLSIRSHDGALLGLHRLWMSRLHERAKTTPERSAALWQRVVRFSHQRLACVIGPNPLAPLAREQPDLRHELHTLASVAARLWESGDMEAASVIGYSTGFALSELWLADAVAKCLPVEPLLHAITSCTQYSPKVARCLAWRATWESRNDRHDAAERLTNACLGHHRRWQKSRTPDYAVDLAIGAMCIDDPTRLRRATRMLRLAIALYRRAVPKDPVTPVYALDILAGKERDLENYSEALACADAGLQVANAGTPRALPLRAKLLYRRGTILTRLARFGEAHSDLADAAAIYSHLYGEVHQDMDNTCRAIAENYRAEAMQDATQGRSEQGRQRISLAVMTLRTRFPENDTGVIAILRDAAAAGIEPRSNDLA